MGKRKTVKFTKASVASIIDLGAAGEWVDSEAKALCLRIQKDGGRPSWSTRITLKSGGTATKTTRRIGCPMTLDYKEARERALEAQKLAARGIDPKQWLYEQEHGGPIAKPADPDSPWLFERLREQYLEHIRENYRPKTYTSYSQCLHYPTVDKRLSGKEITEITDVDIIEIRDTVRYKLGKRSQSASIMRSLGAFFTWCLQDPRNPLQFSPARHVPEKPRTGSGPEINPERRASSKISRVPSLELLRDAERKIRECDLTPTRRLASLLTLFTVQRISSVASARPSDFVELDDGWLEWTVGHTKRHIEMGLPGHIIYLPPKAAEVVRTALAATATDKWLFPQERKRRRGDEGDRYSHESMISKAFRKAKVGFTPHQTRVALATYLGKEGVPKPLRQLILHHAEGESGDVTAEHYDLQTNETPKRELISRWMRYLEPLEAT